MSGAVTDSTSSFLEAAAVDLQRQVARTGVVEQVRSQDGAGGTALIAAIRIKERTIEVRATGDNLVEAYAHLRRTAAEAILAARFVDYVQR